MCGEVHSYIEYILDNLMKYDETFWVNEKSRLKMYNIICSVNVWQSTEIVVFDD